MAAPERISAPPGWPFVAPASAPETPPMPAGEDVGPGPSLPLGSVLGCAHGDARGHFCHWHWVQRYGRYICSACEPGLWATIPKANLRL